MPDPATAYPRANLRARLNELEAHDKETRRLLDAGRNPTGTFDARHDHRRMLAARVEVAAVLLLDMLDNLDAYHAKKAAEKSEVAP